MEHIFEFDCECESCKGTGLYVGLAERDGFGVVCHGCKGTGKDHRIIKYRDFDQRKKRRGVQRVLEVNPGICAGVNPERGLTLESFGGIPYEDWSKGKLFPQGSEMREFVCPAWWYQSADYSKKPKWDCCCGSGSFSDCLEFPTKERCWERWDTEYTS